MAVARAGTVRGRADGTEVGQQRRLHLRPVILCGGASSSAEEYGTAGSGDDCADEIMQQVSDTLHLGCWSGLCVRIASRPRHTGLRP